MTAIHGGDIYRNQVLVDFSVNCNPFGIPKEVSESLHEAVAHCREYPDPECEALRTAVSGMLGIPGEQLVFGNGASELFMGIIHALRPEKILIPVPSFYGYEYAAGAADGELLFYDCRETDGFTPQEDFLDRLTAEVDLVFIASPNNPTGRRLDKNYLKRLLQRCQQNGIWVVLDECFIDFCGDGCSMIDELEAYDRLLLVRAFTKIYAVAGVRLGYLASCNLPLLQKIKRQLAEWNVSTFAQQAGIACTKQRAYLEESIAYVSRERSFLADGLRQLGLKVFPGEADFILLYSKTPLYGKLLKKGFLIRDCSNFRGLGAGYYRIAVRRREENERLLKAIGECIERD